MPIRPENRARYPKNWKSEIVPAVRKRSRNRCECTGQCGLTHTGKGGRCTARNGKPHPTTKSKVVLTVAHMHGTELESQDITCMFHGCQQCHNRYDAPHRRAGIKSRAHQARASGDLFQSDLQKAAVDGGQNRHDAAATATLESSR